jgi:hypothetical protein
MLSPRTFVAAIALGTLFSSAARAQSSSQPSVLEGVWSRVEQIRPDQTKYPSQPGLRIFQGGHYAWVAVFGEGPRPALPDSATATASQLRSVWGDGAFQAEAGAFRVQGNQLTETPAVSKNPDQMGDGWYTTFSFRLVGDTLYLAQMENPNGMLLGTQPTGRYVRVR